MTCVSQLIDVKVHPLLKYSTELFCDLLILQASLWNMSHLRQVSSWKAFEMKITKHTFADGADNTFTWLFDLLAIMRLKEPFSNGKKCSQ
jgi:hypothetical protein